MRNSAGDTRGGAVRTTIRAALLVPFALAVVAACEESWPPEPPFTDGFYTAERVIDGDTLEVSSPIGEELTVRLIGIDAPERDECFYDEATEALATLVGDRPLTLVADVSDVDRFGRALRYVEVAGGVDIGAELVGDGFAIARRYEPDTSRADAYEAAMREAEGAGVGLWGTCHSG